MLNKILCMFIAIFLHLTGHELGHILFGAVTGYSLVSSQILVFRVEASEKSLRFRIAQPVWGGITYMIPKQERQKAYAAYSLGGVIVNAFFTAAAIAISLLSCGRITRFTFIFSMIGAACVVCNTVPFWIDKYNNDGNDVYLFSRNSGARDAYFSALQIERQLYLGKDILSVDRKLLNVDVCDNVYSWNLTKMNAFLLLLDGRSQQQRNLLSELQSQKCGFLKEQENVIRAMIVENCIVSGAAPEIIRNEMQRLEINDLMKEDPLIANRILFGLTGRGILEGASAPEEYLKQYQKQMESIGSKANSILAKRLMDKMNEVVLTSTGDNT